MKRVALHTLGCKLNFAESSTIGRQFRERGYDVVKIDEVADVCVINTCSVTDRADRECRQIIRRALRCSPGAFVIVVGCYAQLRPDEMARIPGVDLVLGTKEKAVLFLHADGFRKLSKPKVVVSPISELESVDPASSVGSADRTRAFLKIQDGCDYSCSFCTIPLARGSSRSLGVQDILAQARGILEAGFKEIVLTGVNVGDFGKKVGTDLVNLLKSLVDLNELERVRISSIEPNLLDDTLLDFWLANPKVCKHFHMPLQGGSDELLKSMRRRYLTGLYANRVHAIKAGQPDAAIGADVIVGFPGESDRAFEETYRFLVDLPVSYLHVFTYSERPSTLAATLPGRIEPRVRFERSERLRLLSVMKRHAFYEGYLGKTVDVLFEGASHDGWMTGLTGEYVRVAVPSVKDLTNQIRRVRLTQIHNERCLGELDTSLQVISTFQPHQCEESLCT